MPNKLKGKLDRKEKANEALNRQGDERFQSITESLKKTFVKPKEDSQKKKC